MSGEDMTVDVALTIAAHANRYPAINKHTALRVLAQAYRVELAKSAPRCTCDYAGIEGERHKDFCEIEGGPHVECRYRIAELEVQQGEPTSTEWGVRLLADERHDVAPRGLDETQARAVFESWGPDLCELVSRTTASPWRVSS